MANRMSTELRPSPQGVHVGIVGASGLVGGIILSILAERQFPVASLRLFASARSAGRYLRWKHTEILVEDASTADYSGLDIAFFSAGASTSLKLAPVVAATGAVVVDNSSAWRMDADVPLVVAEVNSHALKAIQRGIVANPNCTTMAAMPVLKPLHEAAGLQRMVVSTYQAVSGGGITGVRELEAQVRNAGVELRGPCARRRCLRFSTAKKMGCSHRIQCSASQLSDCRRRLHRGRGQASRREFARFSRIPELLVSSTCVRVPVYAGHSLSINAQFKRDIPVDVALELLRGAAGVVVADVPNPLVATGRDPVFVGRVRRDPTVEHGLALFVTGDNLRKGAALNAVQIAEILCSQIPRPVMGDNKNRSQQSNATSLAH